MHTPFLRRIWSEIEQVNKDFFNLRTVISPDPDDDPTRFYFAILPNDGALAHLTLIGSFYITKQYPQYPPVIHLFTTTLRYNVDVYRSYLNDKSHSTLCFDILRSENEGGSWRPDFTLSSLFASLLSALVSFNVMQEGGQYKAEPVSMSKLRQIKQSAQETFDRYQNRLPSIPSVPLVEATPVPATSLFAPSKIFARESETISSQPIYLQTDSKETYSFAIDLSNLRDYIIFSVILSTSFTDLLGKDSDTVLVRNGVTATAARKRAGEATTWFYHGKPMNDGEMRLHVTIAPDQMTFAYRSQGKVYVHGDCPVSRLGVEQIGDVRGKPFYVHIYTKNKKWMNTSGKREAGVIEILDIEGTGYVYESGFDDEGNDFGFEKVHADEANGDDQEVEGKSQDKVSGLFSRLTLR